MTSVKNFDSPVKSPVFRLVISDCRIDQKTVGLDSLRKNCSKIKL